eukprot:CAMPEP_0119361668 /NCGR_PEP_ID=MMETSP1334-20130426/8931_1 /TAXON_ID=127549 /ORGANISM="Calcidiscus leptoporus, Strain RCC1130" /LENGTH=46 /DNA_ID= /DNA_START= /DNA_END= /DNA_ORIENTATION=
MPHVLGGPPQLPIGRRRGQDMDRSTGAAFVGCDLLPGKCAFHLGEH